MALNVAILTVSTSAARGQRGSDSSGAAIREMVEAAGWVVASHDVVADEVTEIRGKLLGWCGGVDLVVTTGGTGISPTDVTPEATRDVIHRELPGMAEAMRAISLAKTPRAMLSRGVVGVRGRTLIVNLPGSPKGVRECLEVVLPVVAHAIEILQARPTDH